MFLDHMKEYKSIISGKNQTTTRWPEKSWVDKAMRHNHTGYYQIWTLAIKYIEHRKGYRRVDRRKTEKYIP
jgi:hypothetical protein